MTQPPSRREWLRKAALTTSTLLAGAAGVGRAASPPPSSERHLRETQDFILRCRRPDGGYAPSPDPRYAGNSDTGLSDLAAVTYAAVLARTFGWELPRREDAVEFLHRHQQKDGRFLNLAGKQDPRSDLALLYNTTQGVVGLHALGAKPRTDPAPVLERFFVKDAYRKLPWYMISFFPLCYTALGRPFPREYRETLAGYLEEHQAPDGYLGDHVAATFHLAHFFRLIGRPVPRADRMVRRVLHDQKPDGGWNIKAPDWDVHACFDAVFILRQLGGDSEEVRSAIRKAAGWARGCRNADGGFGHFPGWHSDMDAVYFQLGTLIQAGQAPGARMDLPDAPILGWGHAMQPGRNY